MDSFTQNDSGQTSVEYVLLLVVLVVILMSVMSQVKTSLIGSSIPCPPDDRALGCIITRSVSSFGTGPSYRTFRLRK